MPDRRGPIWGYPDLALFLSAVLPSLALAAMLSRTTRMVAPAFFGSDAARTLVFQSFMYVFLVGALYLVIAWRYGQPFLPSLGWTFPIPNGFLVLAAGPVGSVRGTPDLAPAALHARVVRSACERREGGPHVDRRGERHEASPCHARTPTVAVNDAVNDAPARTVGWSPVTSALVGAVIGSRQQKSLASGAYTWTKG